MMIILVGCCFCCLGFILQRLGSNDEALTHCTAGISLVLPLTLSMDSSGSSSELNSLATFLVYVGYQTKAAARLGKNDFDAAMKHLKKANHAIHLKGAAGIEYQRLMESIKKAMKDKKDAEKAKFTNAFGSK